jgi:hypothetical protein
MEFLTTKTCSKFYCEKCNYNTDRKSSYDKHLMTSKHNKTTLNNQNMINKKVYICDECEKQFNDRAGLWRHKKKCIKHISSNLTDNNIIKAIVNENKTFKEFMLEQNNDFKSLIIELLKKETKI